MVNMQAYPIRPNLSLTKTVAILLTAVLLFPSTWAGAQEEGDGAKIQRESTKVEPYTGPPIFLPDPPAAVPPQPVEQRMVIDFYPGKDGKPHEAISLTMVEARGFEPTGPDDRQAHVQRTVVRMSDGSFQNNGLYREYYRNGQVFVEGRYDEDQRTGDWKFFHPNGNEAKTVTYEEGVPHGTIELRREDGTLQAKRQYDRGKRTGTWSTYAADGEQVLAEQLYVDGKLDGLAQAWHPNGQLRQQQPFANGVRNGTVIEWDENGKKIGEGNFVDGQREGVSRRWLEDGRVVEQVYEEGKVVSTKTIEN